MPTLKGIRDRLRFKRWGKWIAGGGVLFVIFTIVSVEVTSQSWFCNSCHIMGPYYSSWKHSSHKNVACIQCHIEPGATGFVKAKLNGLGQVVDDVLNRTSNKPSASVNQVSCTRSGCHSVETLSQKKLVLDRFKFDHSKHLGQQHLGVGITCSTCHSHVKGDDHFRVNTSVCITCHLIQRDPGAIEPGDPGSVASVRFVARLNAAPGPAPAPPPSGDAALQEKAPPATCTSCHDAPAREIEFHGLKMDHAALLGFGATCESCHQGVTAPPPVIEDGRCLECHTFGVERKLEAKEMHKVHTLGEHKIECSSCHGSVRHGLAVQSSASEGFDCARCHKDQHGVQRRTYFSVGQDPHGAAGVDRSSPMFLAHVDCTGCHTEPRPVSSKADSGASVLVASPASCDRCHQAGLGERMIPMWQKATRGLYEQLEGDVKSAKASGLDDVTLKPVIDALTSVRTDGSWGVHNPRHTQQVLERARETLRTARVPKEAGR